jgi:hypothetical protein
MRKGSTANTNTPNLHFLNFENVSNGCGGDATTSYHHIDVVKTFGYFKVNQQGLFFTPYLMW